MPTLLLPPAVRIAFVPFCVASLVRSEIDRVFTAHGRTVLPNASTYSKTNLVDAYCQGFDWSKEQENQLFREIMADVISFSRDTTALSTFISVCTRYGVPIAGNEIVTSINKTAGVIGQPAQTLNQNSSVRKVLFLASSPVHMARLHLDKEVREIREALKRSNYWDRFELIQLSAARILDLRRSFLDNSPQIVHFAGHGEADGILVESDDGQAIRVPVNALAGLFELCKEYIECAILNACHSKAQAIAISNHIPFVIGMNAGISDEAAIEFAVGFYDALGAGKSIEMAFRFAKNAIALKNIPEDLTPVLIKKSRPKPEINCVVEAISDISPRFHTEREARENNFSIRDHKNEVYCIGSDLCHLVGPAKEPHWLATVPARMSAPWIVDKFAAGANLHLYKVCGWGNDGTWIVVDRQTKDGVVLNPDQANELRQTPATTTTTAPPGYVHPGSDEEAIAWEAEYRRRLGNHLHETLSRITQEESNFQRIVDKRVTGGTHRKAVEEQSFKLVAKQLLKINDASGYRDMVGLLLTEIERIQGMPSGEKDVAEFLVLLRPLKAKLEFDVRRFPSPK